MAERRNVNILSGTDLFSNYINHGGPPPEVSAQNWEDAQVSVDAALSGHKSFRQPQLNELRRIIGLTQTAINDYSFPKKRIDVLGLLSRYPDWVLRMQVVGDGIDSILESRPPADDLVTLLVEASSLSMRRRRSGPAGTRTQNQ